MEFFGSNRNGDGFNEKRAEFEFPHPIPGAPKRQMLDGGLVEYHNTFAKHGHVFKHHKNTDPQLSIGEIFAEAYNPDAHRGELIIKVANDHADWRDDLAKLAGGKDIPFSMACKVANDICSICSKKSRTRAEYCPHLRDDITELTKEGHTVFAINDKTDYFDISKVARPADRIAWSMYKAAEFAERMGGAELAEKMGVIFPKFAFFAGAPASKRAKMAAAQKLADIEKRVGALARGEDNKHLKAIAKAIPEDMSDKDVDTLRSCQLCDALQALNDAQICLSVHDFMRLMLKGEHKAAIPDLLPAVKGRLPGIFSRLLDSGEADGVADDEAYELPRTASVPHHVRELVSRLASGHSTGHSPVLRRMQITIIQGKKPVLRDSEEKSAGVIVQAEGIAREYAKYQLAFVKNCSEDLSYGGELTVLRNFAKV
jgi:recombinational DNA repair protein RecR